MDDVTYLTILRFIHIFCGTFWAGSVIYVALFIQPAVKALGPDGGKFMQQLAKTNRLPIVILIMAALTIIAGSLLIWELSAGLQAAWMGTRHGIILSTGASLAIIAFLIGVTVNKPAVGKIAAISRAIATQGSPPTAEQMQQLGKLRERLFMATNIVAVLLAATVVFMSIVRYL